MQRLSSSAREDPVVDSISQRWLPQPILHALPKPDIIPVRGEVHVTPCLKLAGPLWLPIHRAQWEWHYMTSEAS